MPSPSYDTNNEMFDAMLATNARIIFASILSYLCSEPFNSLVIARLKIKLKGNYLGLRFITSTVVASGIDSFIFGTVAFYGIIENINLFYLIITMWFLKTLIEIMALPLTIRLANKLKKIERIDIYDINTNFNIFSLDTEYAPKNNEYQEH